MPTGRREAGAAPRAARSARPVTDLRGRAAAGERKRMTAPTQVLFIHGAGEGAYEEGQALADSLSRELGPSYEMRYPRMPAGGSRAWRRQIADELSQVEGRVPLVAHSLGGSVVLQYLAEDEPAAALSGVFLIAPAYWGAPDWEVEEYALRADFASALAEGLPLHFYHSRDDEWVPFSHLARYREVLPEAVFREFDGRGHQFGDDLTEVARDIERLQTVSG